MHNRKKVALVTGASKGIGREIAINLAQNNFDVIINYRSKEDIAQETVDICKSFNSDAIKIKADVTIEEEVKSMLKKIVEKYGTIDVLVNNAGITKDNLILRMSLDDFKEVVDANLNSTFLTSREVIKIMMKKRTGSIINLSSIVGIRGNMGQSNYSASKAGIIGLSKSLAKEFSSRNIRINCVAPGFIETDMTNKLKLEQIENLKKDIPLNRLGTPKDIANIVVFLAKEESSYITGQVISVDGGMNI